MSAKITFVLSLFALSASGQFPEETSSAKIYHQLLKLKETSRVLYIAAHPDDENTRLISYLENGLHARVAYLSLTRGDGGQNLIGTEIGDGVGLLRTQELLQARRIDGGEQYFTRAVDFGYSKSADESLEKWGEDLILSDVVRIIRYFKPDVIITRFPPTRDAGHGHHESSALLAAKAFDKAADPKAYPEQVKDLGTWQTERMYFNASSWWDRTIVERAANNPDYAVAPVGDFDPLLGETYSQVAAKSRSQHRSQGFGSDYPYGLQQEYMQYVKGGRIPVDATVISGLKNTWASAGFSEIGKAIDQAIAAYDFKNPSASLPKLAEIGQLLSKAKPQPWLAEKIKSLNAIILVSSGAAIQFTTDRKYVCRGDQIKSEIRAVNVTDAGMRMSKVMVGTTRFDLDTTLVRNMPYQFEVSITVPKDAPFSDPYWLRNDYTNSYNFDPSIYLIFAEHVGAFIAQVDLRVLDYNFTVDLPLQEKFVDPAKQVIFTPVNIVPKVTANLQPSVLIAPDSEKQTIRLELENRSEDFSGEIYFQAPNGWTIEPTSASVSIAKGGKQTILADISRSPDAKSGNLEVSYKPSRASAIEKLMALREIKYDHIPSQIILNSATMHCTAVKLDRGGVQTIGYIEGSGDLVASNLEAAGYQVDILSASAILSAEALKKYDAIITGIRAYNTREDLTAANSALSEYVRQGGTWLVQYNTSRGLKSDQIGPVPFSISRDRVTEEDAKAEILLPTHPVFNYPNKIANADFDSWVQERGLYFAETWDDSFTPLIGWKDRSENELTGSLIVAPYGSGYFAYTGISFFRQLPAGVPGAYRLLANILALSQPGIKSSNE